MNLSDLILEPKITEKSSVMLTENKYVFLVLPQTNSIQVRQFIEQKYNVDVLKVNMVKVPSKRRRRGRIVGRTAERKKAIVTLKEGHEIAEIKDLF